MGFSAEEFFSRIAVRMVFSVLLEKFVACSSSLINKSDIIDIFSIDKNHIIQLAGEA